jgi:hypothetical protein
VIVLGWGAAEWLTLIGVVVAGIGLLWTAWNTQRLVNADRQAKLELDRWHPAFQIDWGSPGAERRVTIQAGVRNVGRFRAADITPEVWYLGKPVLVKGFPSTLPPDAISKCFRFTVPMGESDEPLLPSQPIRVWAQYRDGNDRVQTMDECFVIDRFREERDFQEGVQARPYITRPAGQRRLS